MRGESKHKIQEIQGDAADFDKTLGILERLAIFLAVGLQLLSALS